MYHTDRQMFSEAGTTTITSASGSIGGEFVAIQCIEATTFTSLTESMAVAPSAIGGSGANLAVGQTYPAGFTLFGRFTGIEVATGAVRVTLASKQA
jgi:hypothetical protein